jgi:organic radical activating enzyme
MNEFVSREAAASPRAVQEPVGGTTAPAPPMPEQHSKKALPPVLKPLLRFEGAAADPGYRSQLEAFARNPTVMLELSSRCNFHCDYCRSSISDRQKSTMSRELFNHLLPQLKELTERRLRLHIDGEPMLHPEFLELSGDANRAGFRLAVASNASALREDFLVIDMDLFIHLSTSAEEHARRSKGSFEHYLERIRSYLKGWIQGPCTQEIELKVFFNARESVDEALMRAKRSFVAEFAEGLGLDTAGRWQPPDWQPELVYRNASGAKLRLRYQQTTEGGLYPNISGIERPGGLPLDWGFCDSPWKTLAVHSDGSVGFCCVDITGKTIFTTPEEIWEKPLAWIWRHHPKLVEAREQFLAGHVALPVCRECLEISPHRESYLFTEIFPGDPRS